MVIIFLFFDLLCIASLGANLYYGTEYLLVLSIAYAVIEIALTLFGMYVFTTKAIEMEDVNTQLERRIAIAKIGIKIPKVGLIRNTCIGLMVLLFGLLNYNVLAISLAVIGILDIIIRAGVNKDSKKFLTNVAKG